MTKKKGWLDSYEDGGDTKPYVAKDQKDFEYRQQMYNDSLALYELQNKLNAEFLNPRRAVPRPGNNDVDLNLWKNLKEAGKDAYNYTTDENTSIKEDVAKFLERALYIGDKKDNYDFVPDYLTTVFPGKYIPNTEANSSSFADFLLGDDSKTKLRIKETSDAGNINNIPIKGNTSYTYIDDNKTINPKTNNIFGFGDYHQVIPDEDLNKMLSGKMDKPKNYGSTYYTANHPTISPINYTYYHENLDPSTREYYPQGRKEYPRNSIHPWKEDTNPGGHSSVIPSSNTYNDALLRNIELPNYKKPTQKVYPPSEPFPNKTTDTPGFNREITKMPTKPKSKKELYREEVKAKGGNPDYKASLLNSYVSPNIPEMPTRNYTQERIGEVMSGTMEDDNVKLTQVAKQQGPSGAGFKGKSGAPYAMIQTDKGKKPLTYEQYQTYFLEGKSPYTENDVLTKKQNGGTLPKYKNGKGKLKPGTEEYKQAYNEGNLTRYNPNTDEYAAPMMPPVEISAEDTRVKDAIHNATGTVAKDYMYPVAKGLAELNPVTALTMAGFDIYDEARKGNYGAAALYGGLEALPWGLDYAAKGLTKGTINNILDTSTGIYNKLNDYIGKYKKNPVVFEEVADMPISNNALPFNIGKKEFSHNPTVRKSSNIISSQPGVNDTYKELLDRITTPEGLKRLKENYPGNTDDIINSLKTLELKDTENIKGHLGSASSSLNNVVIEQGLDPRFTKNLTRHELEHILQGGRKTNLDNNLSKLELLYPNYKELADIERNMFNGVSVGNINVKPKTNIGDLTNILSPGKATDYFMHGSKGMEKSAFLGELQQFMVDKGYIKHAYDNITPKHIEKVFKDIHPTLKSGRLNKPSGVRIVDIATPNKNNYKLISTELNKLGILVPTVGIAGATALSEKQNGGWLDNL